MHFYGVSVISSLICLLNIFSAGSASPTYLQADISLNCGSTSDHVAFNGQKWIEDKPTTFLLTGVSTSSSVIHNVISDDPVIYKTSRISYSPFSYLFYLSPGQKIIRFHFNPTTYKGFKNSKDLFNVEAGQFTLMSNFSASLAAQILGVNTLTKEFYLSLEENQQLYIIFSPSINPSEERVYAFVNGIEIISVPAHLSYFRSGDIGAQLVGMKSQVYIDNNTALEIIHRLNVKRELAISGNEFDVFGMWATFPKLDSDINNLTWKRCVDVGFKYLVRIHFSKLGFKMANAGNVMVKVLVNDRIVDTNTAIVQEGDRNGNILYRDYLVLMKGRKQEGQRDLSISLQSNCEFIDEHGLLKGFEIFKLSNHDNSLASPNPNLLPPPRNSPFQIIQNYPLSNKNIIPAIILTSIALVSITIHMLSQVLDVNVKEEQNKLSALAERLCRRFSLAEIQIATRNFSSGLVIGRGGFGKVYIGQINNGQETVAIKRLMFQSHQGKQEFFAEIETLSKARHINLITLIGFCNEGREMILVYEYINSGTLADHLYKRARHNNCNDSPLTWKQRLNICIGAGRGLDYLHTGHGIIHRDVKASNILLDENFISKVADFGLVKPENRSKLESHVSTKVKGTRGYMDPHYRDTGRLTRKSDTYAFGVVLLQVLCGRPAMDPMAGDDEYLLTKWAQKRINTGEMDQIVASSLIEEISPDSLKVFVGVACRCLHDEPKKRPTMAQVVSQLEFALEHQDSKNQQSSVANGSFPCEDETLLPTSSKERTVAFTDVQVVGHPAMGQRNNNIAYPTSAIDGRKPNFTSATDGRKTNFTSATDGRKPRFNKLRAWDALWSKVKPSKKNKMLIQSFPVLKDVDLQTTVFSLRQIKAATNNFDPALKIGEGGFGPVFKGILSDGTIIAVKMLSGKSKQGNREFFNEIGMLSALQHPYLVKLHGCCIEGKRLLLIYEYMENNNLAHALFGPKEHQTHLDWPTRHMICIGVAKGLAYLHEEARLKIVHRDIKATNVLLDKNLKPKISDFGLAKLDNEDDTRVAGTFGYMAPEYAMRGYLTGKADIYSFGVLLLEIVSGISNTSFIRKDDCFYLLDWANELNKNGNLMELADRRFESNVNKEEVLTAIHVALHCTNVLSTERPSMSSVVSILEGKSSIQGFLQSRASSSQISHKKMISLDQPKYSDNDEHQSLGP